MHRAADLYGLSNDFPCVTQYTNEYGAPDLTAPGFPFCSAAWSKLKGAPSVAFLIEEEWSHITGTYFLLH